MAELKKLGRYELRRILGQGAMGVVYEGFDPTIGRRVAVKTILKNAAISEETARAYSALFSREAQAAGRLSHPNIIQIYDFAEERDIAYLVMEFIQGRELRGFFDAKEKFDTAETVRIMGELLDALEFAHQAGVVHRDIKPANIMLDAQRRVKLADFGVARIQESERSAAGTMVGTPAFMSPEQISGGKIDRRTDVFSAGVVLYQLLTGGQPFSGEGAWTVAKKIMETDPPPPSSVVQSVSPVYDAIVDKALAKNPAERYGSAKEFAGALRGALAPGAQTPAAAERRAKSRAEPKASETEIEFWRALQNSTDAAEFEFYLEQFPEGTYAPLARHKIAKLRESPDAQATVRLEAEAQAKLKAAEERARQEADAQARREAEAKAKREAEEKALREALEKTRREVAEKTKRESEEKIRQAQALARLRQQQEATARARASADDDATVAIGNAKGAASQAERKSSYALPAVAAIVVIAAGIGAYLFLSRTQVPVPVAKIPAPPKVEAPSPVPQRAEVSAADLEKIRKETEERVRREYADKSAAEQAKAMKAAADKAVQEKQLAVRASAEKAVAERVAAAERAAVAGERAAAERVAAAEKAARIAAEKAAEEKVAAAKTAEKAAEAAKPPPVSVAAVAPIRTGLPGRYAFRFSVGSGAFTYCDRNGFEEDIVIPAGGSQSISGRQFSGLQFQSAQDGSVSARMFDGSNRFGSGEAKLSGRATASGYAGIYEARYQGNAAFCAGQWSLVRK